MKDLAQSKQQSIEVVDDNTLDRFNSKTVVESLSNLMTKVTEKDCTPDTVNAACNCAGRITDILRLHLEAERMKRRQR